MDTPDRCPLGAEMDTSRQVPAVIADKSESLGAAPRQRRSIAEKRRIVEETLVEGTSVARVARAHGINANQVFGWRRLYLGGRLGERKPAFQEILPRRMDLERSPPQLLRPPACWASAWVVIAVHE